MWIKELVQTLGSIRDKLAFKARKKNIIKIKYVCYTERKR